MSTSSATASPPPPNAVSSSSIITAIRQSRGLTNQQIQAVEQHLERNPSSMNKLISDYPQLSPQQLEQELLKLIQTQIQSPMQTPELDGMYSPLFFERYEVVNAGPVLISILNSISIHFVFILLVINFLLFEFQMNADLI